MAPKRQLSPKIPVPSSSPGDLEYPVPKRIALSTTKKSARPARRKIKPVDEDMEDQIQNTVRATETEMRTGTGGESALKIVNNGVQVSRQIVAWAEENKKSVEEILSKENKGLRKCVVKLADIIGAFVEEAGEALTTGNDLEVLDTVRAARAWVADWLEEFEHALNP